MGILNTQMAQSSTGTGDDNPVSRLKMCLLQRTVDRDTSAKDRSGLIKRQSVRDFGEVSSRVSDVLLERSIDRICLNHPKKKSLVSVSRPCLETSSKESDKEARHKANEEGKERGGENLQPLGLY